MSKEVCLLNGFHIILFGQKREEVGKEIRVSRKRGVLVQIASNGRVILTD